MRSVYFVRHGHSLSRDSLRRVGNTSGAFDPVGCVRPSVLAGSLWKKSFLVHTSTSTSATLRSKSTVLASGRMPTQEKFIARKRCGILKVQLFGLQRR